MTAQAVENGFVDLEKRKPRPWGKRGLLGKRGIGDRGFIDWSADPTKGSRNVSPKTSIGSRQMPYHNFNLGVRELAPFLNSWYETASGCLIDNFASFAASFVKGSQIINPQSPGEHGP